MKKNAKKSPKLLKDKRHERRRKHVRKKISGTADIPRVSVSRSASNLYAQVIDDETGKTLVGLGTLNKDLKGVVAYGGNVSAAENLGKKFAELAKEKGISKVVFDRNGYKFHGRVKAFAQALRDGGLKF
jgi:large subunit ribosomal protein L18